MSSRYFVTLLALAFSLMLFTPTRSNSQVIEATGNSQEAASQLIYYYNLAQGGVQEPDENHIQVTNVNDTDGTWIHVQVFRSYDPDGDGSAALVTCDERDFIDFLTPNDTHVYELDDHTTKNENEAQESVSIDLTSPTPTEGFIVITPIVSDSDFSAKAFPYLIGASNHIGNFSFNAMGRSAVDLSTGEKVADGTPLDGTTNGFVLLQPSELEFNFEADAQADIAAITFKDVYGDPGLQGYSVEPGDSTWTPFLFDWKEAVTSCGTKEISCYSSFGLHDDITKLSGFNHFPEQLLCAGATTPGTPMIVPASVGWSRIFVSGLEGNENQLGVYVFNGVAFDAKWMNSNR